MALRRMTCSMEELATNFSGWANEGLEQWRAGSGDGREGQCIWCFKVETDEGF